MPDQKISDLSAVMPAEEDLMEVEDDPSGTPAGGKITIGQLLDMTRLDVQTGSTFTLALTNANGIVTMDSASANTVTIPTNAAVAFAIGTVIDVVQRGAGATTVAGAAGVAINGTTPGSVAIPARYEGLRLIKVAADIWIALGVSGAGTLAGLSDTAVSGPSDGQVLTYDSGASKWVPETPAGGGGSGAWSYEQTITATGGSQILLDVTGHADVRLMLRDVSLDTSARPIFRVSPDGGTTVRNGASDYRQLFFGSAPSASVANIDGFYGAGNGSGTHEGYVEFFGLSSASARTGVKVDVWLGSTYTKREGWQNTAEAIDTIVIDASGGTFDAMAIDVFVR